jgi:hypothetical protein
MRVRWKSYVVLVRGIRSAYMISVETPEGKRPLERPGRRRKENIKTNLVIYYYHVL